MTASTGRRWPIDPIVVVLALTGVLVGSIIGARGHSTDVDEQLFRSTLLHMQDGAGFYEAHEQANIEKHGIGPSQVRSLRTPVVATVLVSFPASTWRWLATIPALALCFGAATLAGPDLFASRIAAGLTSLWMLLSLPLLYLHQELWGAPFLVFGALQLRRGRDGPASVLCFVATAIREQFGLSLVIGLVLRRHRRPWIAALIVAVVGASLHVRWASQVLDPAGFETPLRGLDPYLTYTSLGGKGGAAQAVGAVLLVLASIGFWLRRHEREQQFLVAFVIPVMVAGVATGRSYWALMWCGITSAAAAVALRRFIPEREASVSVDT